MLSTELKSPGKEELLYTQYQRLLSCIWFRESRPRFAMSTPEPPKTLGLYKLDEISPTESIFKGVDAAGKFQFRTDLLDSHAGRREATDRLLTERGLIAMGLTEVCCKLGRGKVG